VEGVWLDKVPPVNIVEASGQYDRPFSGDYDGISATYEGETYRGVPVKGRLEVRLHPRGGGDARMEVDPVTWGYHTTAGPVNVAAPSGFGADALARWLRGYGVDTSEPKTRQTLEGLAYTFRGWTVCRWRGPGGFWSSSGSSGAEARTVRGVVFARIGFALTWIAGTVWLARRSWSAPVLPIGT
jgi:hypothetical protein